MTTKQLHNIREAAQRFEAVTVVAAYDIVQGDTDVLEITVGPNVDRVPPIVLEILSDHSLGVTDVLPRPNGHYVVFAQ